MSDSEKSPQAPANVKDTVQESDPFDSETTEFLNEFAADIDTQLPFETEPPIDISNSTGTPVLDENDRNDLEQKTIDNATNINEITEDIIKKSEVKTGVVNENIIEKSQEDTIIIDTDTKENVATTSEQYQIALRQ